MAVALLLLGLVASPPVYQGPGAVMPSPATVVQVDQVYHNDFSPPVGTGGLTLPAKGADLGADGDNSVVALTPVGGKAVSVWLPLGAEAPGRFVRVHLRARVDGEGTAALQVAAVEGTRTAASAESWASRRFELTADWSELHCELRLPATCDALVFKIDEAEQAVWLDDLSVELETRQHDRTVAALAARTGNLIVNGGFEAGTSGFQAVLQHDSLGPDDPPVPWSLRSGDRDAAEGQRTASTYVFGGKVVVSPPVVVLKPATKYTFSLSVRALGAGAARLGLYLLSGDGRVDGRKEVALTPTWRRLKTSLTTPQHGANTWLPVIEAYPGDEPYGIDLDAMSLQEGEGDEYQLAPEPVLTIGDGLGTGHIAAPDQPVKLTAQLRLGPENQAGEVELQGTLVSHLGTVVRDLTPVKVEAKPGEAASAQLLEELLEPGWYRCTVTAMREGKPLASAELILASAPWPEGDDGWRLAVDWTMPDALLRGRSLQSMLEPLPRFGITTRWLRHNAATLWSLLEPQPGRVETLFVAAMIADGAQAGLGTVIELNPFPAAGDAPPWLIGVSELCSDGCLEPPAEVWARFVTALGRELAGKGGTWAISDHVCGESGDRVEATKAALAVGDPDSQLAAADGAWHRLPELAAGPFETDAVELSEAVPEEDPWELSAQRAQALLAGCGTGARRFIYPNQGTIRLGSGGFRHAGLTTVRNGPRPFVAVWSTLRRLAGQRVLAAQATGGHGLHALRFSGDGELVVLWADAGTAKLEVKLSALPKGVLATGEEVALPGTEGAVSLAISPWPLYLPGLSASDAAAVLKAVAGAAP